jgi:hypothetical protein
MEALYFRAKGFVPFLPDSKIDHWHKGLSGEEGVCLLAGEDPAGIGIFLRSEGARVARAVASPWKEEFWVVQEEVIPVKRGVDRASPQSWDGVVVVQGYSFDVTLPVVSGYDPKLFNDFRDRRAWAIVEVRRWWSRVQFIWHSCPWWTKEIEFLDGYLRVPDDEQLVDVCRGRTASGFAGIADRVEISVVPEDLYNSMEDRPSWSLRGLVVLPCDEDATADCSGGRIKDIQGRVSGLVVIAEHLYHDAQELPVSLSLFVAVIGLVAWVEHRYSSHDVCGVYCCSLYLSKSFFVWEGECGLATRKGVVGAVAGGRHERERMSLCSCSLLLLTVWTFPPWA